MLQDQGRAPRDELLKLLRHARRERFGARQPLRQRSHLGAPRRQVFLFRLRVLPECGLLFHRLRDFLFRRHAGIRDFATPLLRGLGPPLRRCGITPQPRKFGLAGAQFHSEPHHVAARLVALQCCRDRQFLRFHVLRHGLLERQFAGAKLFFDVVQRRLCFRSRAFELQHLGIERAQLTLHAQRSRFRWAAAAHHAALIGGAIGCDEGIRRILAREPLRHRGRFHQERRLQPRQELLRRRPQRIAEFHQAIEPRNGFLFDLEGHDRLVRLQIQLAERVHEERRAPADFVAQQRDARAGHVKGLHDDVFQFVAQELLDWRSRIVARLRRNRPARRQRGNRPARAPPWFEANNFCTASAV